jgi:hypothetical protein
LDAKTSPILKPRPSVLPPKCAPPATHNLLFCIEPTVPAPIPIPDCVWYRILEPNVVVVFHIGIKFVVPTNCEFVVKLEVCEFNTNELV